MSYKSSEKELANKKAYYESNKIVILAKTKAYYAKNREAMCQKAANYSLKIKYWPHLTPTEARAEFNRMYTEQGGVCAICFQPETKRDVQRGKVTDLAVDHCSKTKKVRGLLCFVCNTNLGRFERNMESINNYLKKAA